MRVPAMLGTPMCWCLPCHVGDARVRGADVRVPAMLATPCDPPPNPPACPPIPRRALQVLLYDSVDSYIADCKLFQAEVAAHVVTAVDYKDNATLLEDYVNKMAQGCLVRRARLDLTRALLCVWHVAAPTLLMPRHGLAQSF